MVVNWTPGPWCVTGKDRHGQPVVCAEHYEVATCWHHSVGSIEKEAHANACLISAAPDLYKTLKEVKEACLFSEDNGEIGVTEDVHIPSELFDKICKVLNKPLLKKEKKTKLG